jgi:AcrR family transcriptional regulator
MFIERGFDAVTVGEIAAEVGMAPSTLYRHFATKEDIVLWDEHDVAIGAALEGALEQHPPLAAIREVFITELGSRYDADLEFQLMRIKYIYATEQLHAAAVEADFRDRAELAAGLQQVLSKGNRSAATLMAGAALLVLDIAFDRWQRDNAETSLEKLVHEGFEQLTDLDSIR